MTPTFRAATSDDLDTLLALMLAMQNDDPWSVPFREATVRGTIGRLLAEPSAGRIFLIDAAGGCVGYLVLSFDFSVEYGGRTAWVDELFVLRECRNRGIGARSLQFAAQASRDCGAKFLHLQVNRRNPAIRLYRRLGFEENDRYLMSKPLSI